ncbi:MAG: hypothetical protein CL693_20675 [Cellvibrionaceae bacterium]|nr:hypothetical protein [Cellvibrionaceae bacterium]|tara:strand:+ start:34895 stop:35326 length:432 start_codon:yes stop_codon:yes gene_type:complete
MTDIDWIESSLELLAPHADRLGGLVYPRFFVHFPEAETLFGGGELGKSTQESMIVPLLMGLKDIADGKTYMLTIERWLEDHREYGVTLPMYSVMLDSLLLGMREAVGDLWTTEMDGAWQEVLARLLLLVEGVYAEWQVDSCPQ